MNQSSSHKRGQVMLAVGLGLLFAGCVADEPAQNEVMSTDAQLERPKAGKPPPADALGEFCRSYATKFCALLVHCSWMDEVRLATCLEESELYCQSPAKPLEQGTLKLVPEVMSACLDQLDSLECVDPFVCEQYLAADGETGEPCTGQEQCVDDQYCALGKGEDCGACMGSLADGQPCDFLIKKQCASGHCNADNLLGTGAVDTCGYKGAGQPCGWLTDCGPNLYCKDWRWLGIGQATPGICAPLVEVGGACGEPWNECVEGAGCAAGKCVAYGTVAPDGECGETEHCMEDRICSLGKCIERGKLPLGAPCDGQGQCLVQLFCENQKCIALGSVPVGGSCESQFHCVEGASCAPETSTCVPEQSLEEGTQCSEDEQCVPGLKCLPGSGSESPSLCQKASAFGEPCNLALADTGWEVCGDGLRCIPVETDAFCAPIVPVPDGAACVTTEDCKEYTSVCAANPSGGGKVCTGSTFVDEGASCATPGARCRNSFCGSDGVCIALLAPGAPCSASAQCRSAACVDTDGDDSTHSLCAAACF